MLIRSRVAYLTASIFLRGPDREAARQAMDFEYNRGIALKEEIVEIDGIAA